MCSNLFTKRWKKDGWSAPPKSVKITIEFLRTKVKASLDIGHKIYIYIYIYIYKLYPKRTPK